MKPQIDVSKSALLLLHCQNDIAQPEGKFAFSGVPAQVVILPSLKVSLPFPVYLLRWPSIIYYRSGRQYLRQVEPQACASSMLIMSSGQGAPS